MTTLPAYDLEMVRQEFPICQTLTFLNHASISPVPESTRRVMQAAVQALVDDPMSFFVPRSKAPADDLFLDFFGAIAGLIHAAELCEVVNMTSTSAAINAVAQAIDWQPGDNILFTGVEFPSNAYPWMVLERRGVECRVVAPDEGGLSLEAVEKQTDAHTRLVTVSAIQFLSGHRADLAALGAFCRERGILFAVDAIQAAGHIPIDVQAMQIDILAAGGQKSLMGPPGQGFLYVRREVAERLVPALVGPNAVDGWEHWLHYDLKPRQGAWRFMMGTPDVVGMRGLVASIRFLQRLGLEHIDAWTRHLTQVAQEDLGARGFQTITPTDPALQGPIATFRIGDPADPVAADAAATAMMQRLGAAGIRVTKHWDAHRVPHLRIATHCYNTEDEVRRVGAVLGGE